MVVLRQPVFRLAQMDAAGLELHQVASVLLVKALLGMVLSGLRLVRVLQLLLPSKPVWMAVYGHPQLLEAFPLQARVLLTMDLCGLRLVMM